MRGINFTRKLIPLWTFHWVGSAAFRKKPLHWKCKCSSGTWWMGNPWMEEILAGDTFKCVAERRRLWKSPKCPHTPSSGCSLASPVGLHPLRDEGTSATTLLRWQNPWEKCAWKPLLPQIFILEWNLTDTQPVLPLPAKSHRVCRDKSVFSHPLLALFLSST